MTCTHHTTAPAETSFPYRRILVAVDDTRAAQAALRQAAELAQLSNARLDLLTAVVTPTTTYWGGAVQPMELNEIFYAGVLRHAAAAVDDVPVTTYLVRGSAAREILDHAAAHHCDLIVMGGRGRGRAAAALLGSTSHAVLHGARVPVLIVGATDRGETSTGDAELAA